MYVCEKCKKQLKSKASLNRHTAKFHPDGKAPANTPITPANTPAEENLEVVVEEVKDEHRFECNDCGAPLRKGQEFCPKCHQRLSWEGI